MLRGLFKTKEEKAKIAADAELKRKADEWKASLPVCDWCGETIYPDVVDKKRRKVKFFGKTFHNRCCRKFKKASLNSIGKQK